ncbi:MAG: response regulator [Thaumarchaeota archaeon]|nr:response regulator [Nitrososphaerota archaeon]
MSELSQDNLDLKQLEKRLDSLFGIGAELLKAAIVMKLAQKLELYCTETDIYRLVNTLNLVYRASMYRMKYRDAHSNGTTHDYDFSDSHGSLFDILVFGDDKPVWNTLRLILESYGLRVHVLLSNREEIWDSLENPYGLAFFDMDALGTDSIEFLTKIRQANPDMTVILLTSFADLRSAVEAINRGVRTCIIRKLGSNEGVTTIGKGDGNIGDLWTAQSETVKFKEQPIMIGPESNAAESHATCEGCVAWERIVREILGEEYFSLLRSYVEDKIKSNPAKIHAVCY